MSKEQTPRQQAIDIIKSGGSVVVNQVQYTEKNMHELPPEEDFVVGDSVAQTETLETLKVQEKAIQERIKALEATMSTTKKAETPVTTSEKEVATPVEAEKKNK